jgi:hypothetical protein
VAASCSQVERTPRTSNGQIPVDGEVLDVDIVAYRRPLGRVVVGAEDADVRTPAAYSIRDNGDRVRFGVVLTEQGTYKRTVTDVTFDDRTTSNGISVSRA